jgi:hypothetical protein
MQRLQYNQGKQNSQGSQDAVEEQAKGTFLWIPI